MTWHCTKSADGYCGKPDDCGCLAEQIATRFPPAADQPAVKSVEKIAEEIIAESRRASLFSGNGEANLRNGIENALRAERGEERRGGKTVSRHHL